MRKKLISSILIVIFFFAVLLGIYKTNYNSIIKTYGGEVSESFPEKIPEEAVKTDVYESSLLESPEFCLLLQFDKDSYTSWIKKLKKRTTEKCKVEDKEIRYVSEDGGFFTKGKYYLPTTFFEKFYVPKTKVKWTYNFVKCSGTQEKEYEWNHGYVCGWAANDEIHTIVYFYENW